MGKESMVRGGVNTILLKVYKEIEEILDQKI